MAISLAILVRFVIPVTVILVVYCTELGGISGDCSKEKTMVGIERRRTPAALHLKTRHPYIYLRPYVTLIEFKPFFSRASFLHCLGHILSLQKLTGSIK